MANQTEMSLKLDQISLNSDDTVKTVTTKLISKGQETMGPPGFKHDTILYYDDEFSEWCFLTNLRVLKSNPQIKFVRDPGIMTEQSWYPQNFLQFILNPFWVTIRDSTPIKTVPIPQWVNLQPNVSILSVPNNNLKPLYDQTKLTNFSIRGGWLIMDNQAATIFFEQNANFGPGDVQILYFTTPEQGFTNINDALTTKDGVHVVVMAALVPQNPTFRIYLGIFEIVKS